MKSPFLISSALFLFSTASHAGQETCDQMRDRIVAQATAKGVKNPDVRIQPKDAALATGDKQVGHCGKGRSIIVYRKR